MFFFVVLVWVPCFGQALRRFRAAAVKNCRGAVGAPRRGVWREEWLVNGLFTLHALVFIVTGESERDSEEGRPLFEMQLPPHASVRGSERESEIG